jgi:hypothetical protein
MQQSPYDLSVYKDIEQSTGYRIHPNLYPPHYYLFYSPFVFFSYKNAQNIMYVMNHIMVLFFIYLFIFKILNFRSIPDRHAWILPLFLLYVVAFFPLLSTLLHGQQNVIIICLICLSWYALKRNFSSALIALPLSIAIILKTYPLVLLPLLVLKRRYKAAVLTVIFSLVVSSVSFLVLPEGMWSDWWNEVRPSGGYGKAPRGLFSPAFVDNQNINAFSSRLFLDTEFSKPLLRSETAGLIVPYVLSFLVLVLTCLSVYISTKLDSKKFIDLEFSLFLLFMFLVAPLSWVHNLVFILPAIIIGVHHFLLEYENYVSLKCVAVLVCALILGLNIPFNYLWGVKIQGMMTLAVSVKFYAVFLLWIILLIENFQNKPLQTLYPTQTCQNKLI